MTHGCTDCGYSYMDECEVYEDGTCKRDRAEAYTEVEANISPWHTGTPTEEGCYYAVVCKGWKRPYNRLAFVYDGKLYCLDDSSDFEDFPHEVVAYQKITPFEASKKNK